MIVREGYYVLKWDKGGAPVAAAASETAADTERATAVGLGGCVVVG